MVGEAKATKCIWGKTIVQRQGGDAKNKRDRERDTGDIIGEHTLSEKP